MEKTAMEKEFARDDILRLLGKTSINLRTFANELVKPANPSNRTREFAEQLVSQSLKLDFVVANLAGQPAQLTEKALNYTFNRATPEPAKLLHMVVHSLDQCEDAERRDKIDQLRIDLGL